MASRDSLAQRPAVVKTDRLTSLFQTYQLFNGDAAEGEKAELRQAVYDLLELKATAGYGSGSASLRETLRETYEEDIASVDTNA